jgi:hypothetical protein
MILRSERWAPSGQVLENNIVNAEISHVVSLQQASWRTGAESSLNSN